MSEVPVTVGAQGRVRVVSINRPEARNALNLETLRSLWRMLQELDEDAGCGAVIVTGSGDRAFVAGADIRELAERTLYTELGERSRVMRDICALLETTGKATIAAINGVALGGGLELALACDLRIASTHAKLGLPEINLGIFPGAGGPQRLLRLCGRGVAAELMMTGDLVTADEAMRLGLVNRVVAPDEVEVAAMALATRIAERSSFAIRAIKDSLRAGSNMGQSEAILYDNKLFALCMETEDKSEGVAAFLEKRSPRFVGR